MSKQSKYYLLFKPYGYLSQFTKEHPDHRTLAELCPGIPKDVFPVGRLDKDSEGLLLLTSDRKVNLKLLHPSNQHKRVYLAQVEGLPSSEALQRLKAGPQIKVGKKKYKCLPCDVAMLANEPELPEREPPIRIRKTVPDSWVQLSLQEGKNRQVRKMCAAVGYPVLRLVRHSIEELTLEGLNLGELREVDRRTFYKKLKL